MDVDVHPDHRLAAGDADRQVGALRADAREAHHQFGVAGQLAAVVVADDNRDVADLDGFALVEGDIVDGDGVTHYTFAYLDQKTLSFTGRMDYTMTPTLTFQLYVQPFVTKGDYSNLRELDQPRAGEYDARYKPFTAISDPGGFNVKQFRSNAVLRWEYRPGSAVYVVWQQGRENYEPEFGGRSFRGDFTELFRSHPDNTFLIKMSYWFDR